MAKKASDEQCRANYNQVCALFNAVVADHDRFQVVYAYGVEVGMTLGIVIRTTHYKYASYAVGFDTRANEIVVVPTVIDLSDHGQPFSLSRDHIKSAKQSFMTKEYTIKDDSLPKKYIQLMVPECINEDPDNVCLLVKQDDEAKAFQRFFKQQFSK